MKTKEKEKQFHYKSLERFSFCDITISEAKKKSVAMDLKYIMVSRQETP